MADLIFNSATRTRQWIDGIEASMPNNTTAPSFMVACPAIQPVNRNITATNGVSVTVDNAAGLFVGTRIKLVVLAGAIPPEATPDYVFQIKSVTGNVVTIAHTSTAPAINWGVVTGVTWQVQDEELSIVSPIAQIHHWQHPLRNVTLVTNINTSFIRIARSVQDLSTTYNINYLSDVFRRSTASGTPATISIKHIFIGTVNNNTTPTAFTEVLHHVVKENPIVLTGTAQSSHSMTLLSPTLINP